MKAVLVLAAAVLAAAGAAAQSFAPRVPSYSAPVAPAASALSALPAASLPTAFVSPSAAPTLIGVPGPGVSPAHLAAVQALADESGHPWVIHGSRQTGVSVHTGETFAADADLDLGVVGTPESMFAAQRRRWDLAPDAEHGPVLFARTVEEAAARGHLVVLPRASVPTPGTLAAAAAPFRTAAQLSKLAASPRADGETFRFEVIGDAEPGRFWFSRALFNRDTGAFWRMLKRSDSSGADFVVQLGDMVSRGIVRNFRAFFARLTGLSPRTPYLTVIGNHDRESPHGASNDRLYRSLFGSTDYFFDRGGRRFVVLDSSAGRVTPPQLDWLRKVLDPKLPTVVFTHMPPAPLGEWTDFPGRKGSGGFREGSLEFMRLMSERGVERVYMGHVHGLGVIDRGGVRYVLTGGGGSPLYPAPVKARFHHTLTVDAGPDGLSETVRTADGRSFPLR